MFELDMVGIQEWVLKTVESMLPAVGLPYSLLLVLAFIGGALGVIRRLRSASTA